MLFTELIILSFPIISIILHKKVWGYLGSKYTHFMFIHFALTMNSLFKKRLFNSLYLHRKNNEFLSTCTCLAYWSANYTIGWKKGFKQKCGQVPSFWCFPWIKIEINCNELNCAAYVFQGQRFIRCITRIFLAFFLKFKILHHWSFSEWITCILNAAYMDSK